MQSKFKIGQTVFWTKNKHWYVVEANLSPAFVALEGYPNPVPVAEIKTEGDVDSFAVVVQGGKPDAPGNVYGAAMALAQAGASN